MVGPDRFGPCYCRLMVPTASPWLRATAWQKVARRVHRTSENMACWMRAGSKVRRDASRLLASTLCEWKVVMAFVEAQGHLLFDNMEQLLAALDDPSESSQASAIVAASALWELVAAPTVLAKALKNPRFGCLMR